MVKYGARVLHRIFSLRHRCSIPARRRGKLYLVAGKSRYPTSAVRNRTRVVVPELDMSGTRVYQDLDQIAGT